MDNDYWIGELDTAVMLATESVTLSCNPDKKRDAIAAAAAASRRLERATTWLLDKHDQQMKVLHEYRAKVDKLLNAAEITFEELEAARVDG